jgi:glycosyltransferase involved in cell wall biosynthesis
MLVKLLGATLAQTDDGLKIEHYVICLSEEGPLGSEVRALGVPLQCLGLTGGPQSIFAIRKVARLIRRQQPDLVQTWMYHADLIGGLAAKLAGLSGCKIPVAWGVRLAEVDPSFLKPTTRLIVRINAALARWIPARIVVNAEAAIKSHTALGYPEEKFQLAPNGFDLAEFAPDPAARAAVRLEFGAAPDDILVGCAGRFDRQKGYDIFVAAAARALSKDPRLRFLAFGDGVTAEKFSQFNGFDDAAPRIHCLGRRSDVPRLTAGLDIFALASRGEGFSNAIGEAMASGVPIVTTNVGDAAHLVGDAGRLSHAGDVTAFSEAILDLASMPPDARAALGARGRSTIQEKYGIDKAAATFTQIWRQILDAKK